MLCRISERAARAARAELIRLGWITKDTGSFQRKLNRDGAYFVINTAWRRVINQSAPPIPEKCIHSAPPKEKQETPYGSKNQKAAQPQPGASQPKPGVCEANQGKPLEMPTLRDIKHEDLRRLSRLRVLYDEATKAKWLSPSEANLQNFIAAAARATRVDGDAVRVFVGIVRKGLWHHLTNEDDERARSALNRERGKDSSVALRTIDPTRVTENNRGEEAIRIVFDLAMKRSATVVPCAAASRPPAVHTLKCL
jgi:hypothetical protein